MAAFPLSKPVRVEGEEVTSLTLREPTIGMLGGVKQKITGDGGIEIDVDTVIKVFAKIANIPPSSAKQIAPEDFPRVLEVYTSFFGGSPETGES